MPIYCELPIWGTLFEPLNTISNLAFMVAAYFVWRLLDQTSERRLRWQVGTLGLLLAAIGVGSGLWHYYGTGWALVTDVIPIQLFLLAFLWFLLEQLYRLVWLRLLLMVGFVATTVFVPVIAPFASGYIGALVFAYGLSYFVYRHNLKQGRYFFITLLIFSLSLTTRQLDLSTCDLTHGHGLHLFWHVLNSYVLYRFARVLLK